MFVFPKADLLSVCCRANLANIRESRPDYGLVLQVKVLKIFQVVPSPIGSGLTFMRDMVTPRASSTKSDYSQVDVLGSRYKFVNFGVKSRTFMRDMVTSMASSTKSDATCSQNF